MRKREDVGNISHNITGAFDIRIPTHNPSTNFNDENNTTFPRKADIMLLMYNIDNESRITLVLLNFLVIIPFKEELIITPKKIIELTIIT